MAPSWSPDDFDKAVRTVWGEARGEAPEGQRAVAAVIANRAKSSGKSLTDTVLAPNQFEPWSSKRTTLEGLDPNSEDYQRIATTIWPVLYGVDPDPTNGATHFYSPKAQAALGRQPPSWDNGSGVDLGTHRFFNLGYKAPTSQPAAPPPSQPTLSSALTTGTTPMATDPLTSQWTPDEIIKSQYGLAQQFRNTPQATSGWGALAQGLGGLFGGIYQGGADNAVRANQDLQSQSIRDAMTSPDMKDQARKLIQSPVPALQMRGAQMLEQLGLKRAEQEEKWGMVSRMLGRPLTPGAPVAGAPAQAPGSMPPAPMQGVPSGVPGVSVGQPQTLPAPSASPAVPSGAPQKPPSIDKYTLGVMVAAGLIPKEAAALLQDDKSFEDAYDKEAGKDFAGAYKGYRESLPKLTSAMSSYNILEKLIQNPATIQGMGAGVRKQFDRAMEAIGIKTEGLPPTQVMEAISNEMTLQMRGTAGGMPGAMSDKDREFLYAMTANTSNSPEANLFLVQMRKRMMQREADIAKMALRYAQNNGGRLDHRFDIAMQDWAEKNPLWSEKEMKALAGQREATVKAPEAAPQQTAAPAAPTVDDVAKAPVGTVLNGLRKVGPNQWVQEGSPQTAPAPAPRPQETPTQRAARKREENNTAAAGASAKAQADAAKVQSEFNTDMQSMQPLALVQKYDALRWQLNDAQRNALNAALDKAMGR